MSTTAEFAVQISCDSCIKKIEDSLKDVEGIKNISISKEKCIVLVESNLPSTLIQEKIESTGRKAVLKGYGNEKGEEAEEFNFIQIEVDGSGFCAICKPCSTSSSRKLNKDELNISETQNDDNNRKETLGEEGPPEKNSIISDSSIAKKNSKNGAKSDDDDDDDEELELKYSSDSDDEDLDSREIALNMSECEDIDWKIEDDMEAECDLVDDSWEDSEARDYDREKKFQGNKNISGSHKFSRKRKLSEQSDDVSDSDVDDTKDDDYDLSKNIQNRIGNHGTKIIKDLKFCKIRKGNFNVHNSHIALQVLILPEEDNVPIKISEAQKIKDSLLEEVFLRAYQVLSKEPGVFLLKFVDCKLVKPGWLLIQCDNKETFDWLLGWNIPSTEGQVLKSVAAIDKTPLQKIKFSIKRKWCSDGEIMLKLVHLQNREIDIDRWVLDERKSTGNGMEQFVYQVDFGSIRVLEKQNWSFFYELFTVKITEYNGKPVNILMKAKNPRDN